MHLMAEDLPPELWNGLSLALEITVLEFSPLLKGEGNVAPWVGGSQEGGILGQFPAWAQVMN